MTASRRQRYSRTSAYEPVDAPARQVMWTRLGIVTGYTNTEPRRTEIRNAANRMLWRDPAELVDVLGASPVRLVITFLLGGRRWALHRAAIAQLSPGPFGYQRRLLGAESVSGERYLLLDDSGYECIHLYTDRPASKQAQSIGTHPSTVDGV
jgi:hypothetical protein